MRKHILLIVALVVGISVFHAWARNCEAVGPPPEGGVLPDIQLPISSRSEDVRYLGIRSKGKNGYFKIPQINAEIVVLEVFNMYCPHCQREAPAVNELYTLIQQRPELKDKVKLIGIGAGNSAFEVDFFRKKYDIPFPLFTDQDFSLHSALGKVGTPYFIVIRKSPDGSHKVIYSKVAGFGDPQKFLDLITKNM